MINKTIVPISPIEKRIIDKAINEVKMSGIALSGEDPIIIGSIFSRVKKAFKRIGSGVKNIVKKIRQRIQERGLSANIQTPEGVVEVTPQGTKIDTPSFKYESGPSGQRFSTDSFQVQQGQNQQQIVPIEQEQPNLNKYMPIIIGGAAMLLLFTMAKK